MTCAQKYVRGLKVHSIMASTTQGVPLGILEQQIWTRPVKAAKKKKKSEKERKSISHKESKRWLTGKREYRTGDSINHDCSNSY